MNKQQILIIGGGDTFDTYEQYLEFLKTFSIDPERLKPYVGWKLRLQEDLGDRYEVFAPKMPNVSNAKYEEWDIWISRVLPLLRDDLLVIGHSLGGVFLAKYLSEKTSPRKIRSAILLAAPAYDLEGEPLASFRLQPLLDNFQSQVEQIYLLHSRDDKVVPFAHLAEYKKLLPEAKVVEFAEYGHFNIEDFPELTSLITNIH